MTVFAKLVAPILPVARHATPPTIALIVLLDNILAKIHLQAHLLVLPVLSLIALTAQSITQDAKNASMAWL